MGNKIETPEIEIRDVNNGDYLEIARIYNYYILNSTNTFHQKPFLPNEIPNLIPIDHPKYRSFVVLKKMKEQSEQEIPKIIGFCAVKAFSPRESYARTAEIVLYLDPLMVHKGFGSEVLLYCEKYAKNVGIKVVLGSISGENKASIRLLEKMGYNHCGLFKEVGEKFGHLLDVVFLQKFL